jgi:hypothetical protein
LVAQVPPERSSACATSEGRTLLNASGRTLRFARKPSKSRPRNVLPTCWYRCASWNFLAAAASSRSSSRVATSVTNAVFAAQLDPSVVTDPAASSRS